MRDIHNIQIIYQQLHSETTDWQVQMEPLPDDATAQQHLFRKFYKLHKEVRECIKQMNNDDFDDDAHDEWQGRVERLQQQMMQLMRSGAFAMALDSKWNHLSDRASSYMNTIGDANNYYVMFLDQMAE